MADFPTNVLPRAMASLSEEELDAILRDRTGRTALTRSISMLNQRPDTAPLQDYARGRQASSQIGMLNALAAQYAGEDFAPIQKHLLDRSASDAEAQKFGDYGYVSGGKFVENPFHANEQIAGQLFDVGKQTATDYRSEIAEDRRDARANARLAAMGGGNGGVGKTQTERFMNTVISGDPASPEYAMAWNYLGKAKTTMDPNTGEVISIPGMDLSRFPKPASSTGVRPTVGAPAIVPEPIRKINAFESAFDKQLGAFENLLTKVPVKEKAAFAITGVKTPTVADAMGAYNMLVGMTRDESLLNTGVLQAGELKWVNDILTNPGTISGLLSGNESTLRSFRQVSDFLKRKIDAKKSAYNHPGQTSVPGAGGATGSWTPEKEQRLRELQQRQGGN